MKRDLGELTEILGYRFRDEALLRQALTHRSVHARNNERLEFLGDSILNFVIAAEVYRQYPKAPEGDLSRVRASLVNKETLARLGKKLELGDFLILGSGELKSGGFRRKSILADAVEAVFGAVYLDNGVDCCIDFIRRHYQPLLSDPMDLERLKDPKTRLQEHLQARGRALPTYHLQQVSGKPHEQVFKILCSIDDKTESTVGKGKSRRQAEQEAALAMLDRVLS